MSIKRNTQRQKAESPRKNKISGLYSRLVVFKCYSQCLIPNLSTRILRPSEDMTNILPSLWYAALAFWNFSLLPLFFFTITQSSSHL